MLLDLMYAVELADFGDDLDTVWLKISSMHFFETELFYYYYYFSLEII